MTFCKVFIRVLVFVASFACLISDATFGFEVVRVDEEWGLEVGEPNVASNAPQVSMVMSPFDNLEEDFFMFLVNHRVAPSYAAGGCQIQTWNGSTLEDYKTATDTASITSTSETVTWTQSMSITGEGSVTFSIKDGASKSWGHFGGTELTHTISIGESNLNGYRPMISLKQSCIGYAGNRVVGLTLLRVTWFMADGQIYRLDAPINIDSDLDPWDE